MPGNQRKVSTSITSDISPSCSAARSCVSSRETASGPGSVSNGSEDANRCLPLSCSATATRNGYVGLRHIAVSAGRLDMRVVPQSVVSGTVLDENGVPEPSAPLQLWQRILRDGSYRMFSIASQGTDDRGRFRMAQLSAGSYRVCVTAWATGYMSSRDLTY